MKRQHPPYVANRILCCIAMLICSFFLVAPFPLAYAASEPVTFSIYRATGADLSLLTTPSEPLPVGSVEKKEPLFKPEQKLLLLVAEVTPPSGNYFYDIKSKHGLPTKFSVACQIEETGHVLETYLFLPPATKKNKSVFSSLVLPGINDEKAPIFIGKQYFFAVIPIPEQTLLVETSLSGLFCSSKSCTPFKQNLRERLSGKHTSDLPAYADTSALQAFLLEPANRMKTTASTVSPTPFAPEKQPSVSIGTAQGLDEFLNQENGIQPNEAESGFQPVYFHSSLEVNDVWKAVGLGILAGLVLNLMPCVLPVVSLKFSALLAVTTMDDKKEQARAFRNHCLIFAAGVMTWFFVLSLLLGGAGWAWGELFQRPAALAALGCILFVLGLSLFGVFSLPIFDLKVSSTTNPHWQAFASGLLATLLATPCSGPLLGGVLGWAVRQPLAVLFLTVMSIGFGMAVPYCFMALSPGLINLLPRPGAWTLRLEQLLGFFLMGSVIYLVLLLPEDWMAGYLIVLLAIAFAAWLWGQIGHLRASRFRRILARGCAATVVSLALFWAYLTVQQDFIWENYDEKTFTEALGKEHILVEFTADWCPNCKLLEQTTLGQKRMARLLDAYAFRALRVDLTQDNKEGSQLLKELGSNSIPLIALFSQGDTAKKPLVLRDIVTPSQLEDALQDAFTQ